MYVSMVNILEVVDLLKAFRFLESFVIEKSTMLFEDFWHFKKNVHERNVS